MAVLGPVRMKDGASGRDEGLQALLSATHSIHAGEPKIHSDRLRRQSERALRWRRAQRDIFPEAALHDSCWDIMLLCLSAELAGRQICVKQIRNELDESQTSVLRRLDELTEAGLLQRQRDEMDGRRTLVRLTATGVDAMSRFFTLIDES